MAEIDSYPIPGWLKLKVRSYTENVDFETIDSDDLSNQDQEIFSIIQQSIGEDFEQLESNINEKIGNIERQLKQLESRLNNRIDRSEAELKRFIGIVVAAGTVCTTGIVTVLVLIF
ncbi:MAG: hypothetical protein OXN25_24250 [Candidatus Poribacteria bacterium]|nr:hypothetical protein [Candidatus Poribacteria bacterium]